MAENTTKGLSGLNRNRPNEQSANRRLIRPMAYPVSRIIGRKTDYSTNEKVSRLVNRLINQSTGLFRDRLIITAIVKLINEPFNHMYNQLKDFKMEKH